MSESKKTPTIVHRINVPFEIKQFNDSDSKFFQLEGLASTFGNTDLVGDIVERGAFKESIKTKTPVILWQHDMSQPIGMPEVIKETKEGLFLKANLPKDDTFVSGRVAPQLRVGSIKSMSIGFRILQEEFDQDDPTIRRIKKVDLVEISLVTFPANPLAAVTGFKQITAVDLKGIENKRDFENLLRESAGFSKDAAIMAAKHYKSNERSESVCEGLDSIYNKLDNALINRMMSKLDKGI